MELSRAMQHVLLGQPERLPDLLRGRVGTYFEVDGLCFAPKLEITPRGACVMAVYFQNRYAGRAEARVQILPMRRWWGMRHALPAAALSFDCPGGAFGVARASFPIAAKYQGRRMTFSITAATNYPQDRGEILRLRQGITPKRWTCTLPQGVAEYASHHLSLQTELIWWPELLHVDLSARLAA